MKVEPPVKVRLIKKDLLDRCILWYDVDRQDIRIWTTGFRIIIDE